MEAEKSYLITGGSGSFGHAFTKHLLDTGKADRIVILSRCEVRQAEMAAFFKHDPRLRFFIGDVRDRERLRRAFEGVEVIIHAAAMKRIEACAYNPSECTKTNVLGAMNVIEAAHDAGVRKVVALSTDKAFQPVSAYGHSKALAESLFLSANNARGANGPRYTVTRYGNVAFSRGSVIPKWLALLDRDPHAAVPVTDPDATRFWMTMDEAIAMVSIAAREMSPDVYIPSELPAFRLGDLATALGAAYRTIGLPTHEKRHESLDHGISSDKARRMTVEEIEQAIFRGITSQVKEAA